VLADLGIVLGDDPTAASYLCADKPLRTEKFMRALAHVQGVLIPSYLVDCQTRGSLIWPIPTSYMLKSKGVEAALRNAAQLRANHSKLFAGYSFNVTTGVKGGFDVFDRIVRAHGAGPSQLVSNARFSDFVSSKGDLVILISPPDKNSSIIKAFKTHHHGKLQPRAFSEEWVLGSVMAMSLDIDDTSNAL
jgi:hypothetical protein